jgi:hypothetical protein
VENTLFLMKNPLSVKQMAKGGVVGGFVTALPEFSGHLFLQAAYFR